MKFNKFTMSLLAAGTLIAGSANAGNMYIDLGTNAYDAGLTTDADTITGTFTEFTLGQLLATSIYDVMPGDMVTVGTTFTDINKASDFVTASLPASGTAVDGSTAVSIVTPVPGQRTITSLAPLTGDAEGFSGTTGLGSWTMDVEYNLSGVVTAGGPTYTSGTFEVFFRDIANSANDFLAFTGMLTGSNFTGANLDLYFDVTTAKDDFLYAESSSGGFVDIADVIASGGIPKLVFDTNVNPPIPTADQLLQVGDTQVRQTTLDSSFTINVPEPSTIGIFGAGLLALAGLRRKAQK